MLTWWKSRSGLARNVEFEQNVQFLDQMSWNCKKYIIFKFKFNLFGFISSHFRIRIDKMIMLNQRCGCHQKRRAWGWWHPVMLRKYRKNKYDNNDFPGASVHFQLSQVHMVKNYDFETKCWLFSQEYLEIIKNTLISSVGMVQLSIFNKFSTFCTILAW